MTIKWAIDVSWYDAVMRDGSLGPIDWGKTGLSMAIMKVSESIHIDRAFEMQWKAASMLPRGAYHYFRSNVDPLAQAIACWSALEKAGFRDSDYVLLDYESLDGLSGSASLAKAKIWLAEMAKHTRPLIYTYPYFWRQIGGEAATWAAEYPLALAQWPLDNYILGYSPTLFTATRLADFKARIVSGNLKPMALKPWTGLPAIWQFTSRVYPGAVSGYYGVKKAVDFDAIFMDLPTIAAPVTCECCGQVIK